MTRHAITALLICIPSIAAAQAPFIGPMPVIDAANVATSSLTAARALQQIAQLTSLVQQQIETLNFWKERLAQPQRLFMPALNSLSHLHRPPRTAGSQAFPIAQPPVIDTRALELLTPRNYAKELSRYRSPLMGSRAISERSFARLAQYKQIQQKRLLAISKTIPQRERLLEQIQNNAKAAIAAKRNTAAHTTELLALIAAEMIELRRLIADQIAVRAAESALLHNHKVQEIAYHSRFFSSPPNHQQPIGPPSPAPKATSRPTIGY